MMPSRTLEALLQCLFVCFSVRQVNITFDQTALTLSQCTKLFFYFDLLLQYVHWQMNTTVSAEVHASVWHGVLPVGWAVGSRAGATQRGRRKESQSEHQRAVIPLEEKMRHRAARPDSDNILRSHAVQQNGCHRCRKKLSSKSLPLTWKTTIMRGNQSKLNETETRATEWQHKDK